MQQVEADIYITFESKIKQQDDLSWQIAVNNAT